jgi:hypothetical protein
MVLFGYVCVTKSFQVVNLLIAVGPDVRNGIRLALAQAVHDVGNIAETHVDHEPNVKEMRSQRNEGFNHQDRR